MRMQTLSASSIRYLIAMHLLSNDIGMRCTDIAEVLNVTKPSVHRMVKILCNIGFVQREKYGRVFLTEKGEELASRYASYNDTVYRFLRQKLALSPEKSKNAAFALLAGVSDEHIKNMCEILQNVF